MAVKATLYSDSSMFSIDLYPGDSREWVSDVPDDRPWPFDFDWDARKLEGGTYELGAIRIGHVGLITEFWLRELDTLDLPRIDLREAGLHDVTISDALRLARQALPSRFATSTS